MTQDLLKYAQAMRARIVAGEGIIFYADETMRLRDFFASVEEILDQHQDQCVRLNEQLRAELIDSDKARSRAEAQVEEMAMRRDKETPSIDPNLAAVARMALDLYLSPRPLQLGLGASVHEAIAIWSMTRQALNPSSEDIT